MANVKVVPDQNAVGYAAAEYFLDVYQRSVTARGCFCVALSGGSTPRYLHRLLANEAFSRRIDWAEVDLYWSDERCVPPDHPDSNYRMARQTLIDFVPIPQTNVHRILAELDPQVAAADYERVLKAGFTAEDSRFDLILLGMGSDGHTASLFPGSAALDVHDRLVVANYVEKLSAWRITFTAPFINAAAHVVFMVTGEEKADALRAVLKGEHHPHKLPAQFIKPEDGELLWIVDEAAASRL